MRDGNQLSRVGEVPPVASGVDPMFAVDEQLDLSKYFNAVRRRWLLLLVCVLVTTGYAVVRYTLTPKEYQARTTIQIERKRLSLLALGQAAWMEDWWNMEYYPTQYRLLRSRGMAERVVLDLRLFDHPAFGGGGGSQLDLTAADRGGLDSASSMQLARMAMGVQGGLEVTPIPETQLVEIIYRSTSPELAAQISNTYAEVFIQWGKENRTDTVNQASSFLDSQIETLRQEIEEGQKRLNSYQSSSDFALDPAGEALLERRQSLDQRYNSAVAARISKEAAYRGLLNLSPDTVANTQSGGRVSGLKAELSRLEVDYESKLEEFEPHWPEMVSLRDDIDKKKGELQRLTSAIYAETKDRAFAEFQKAKGEEESLEDERRKLAADARLQNSGSLEYTDMLTYISTRRELLAELVKRQSEVASQMQTTKESNVRIVDRAIVPSAPFRPSLRRNLSIALGFGLMAGLGIALLMEFLDRTIKTPEELESITGLPTLTVIPDISEGRGSGGRFRYGKKGYGYGYGYGYGGGDEGAAGKQPVGEDGKELAIELLPHANPRLAICEAYRSLRTALLLSSTHELRTVAVTSAEPGEGKTATTVNLAVVMAQLGRRVLIVDADLRRPRMHKVFALSNRLGLVSFLTGHLEVDRIFADTLVPNLFVATSGPIPPNPSELLSSTRMREFLDAVKQKFDFVIIDTPPALPVADAVILGPLADGLIVCVRAGVLQRDDAKMCREQLRYAGVRIFGTVLNRYRSSPTRYSRRYQYYGVYSEPAEKSSSAA